MGIEPTTSSVTGQRSNQLSYGAISGQIFIVMPIPRTQLTHWSGDDPERLTGFEPVTPAWQAGILPLNYSRAPLSFSGIRKPAYMHITSFAIGFEPIPHHSPRGHASITPYEHRSRGGGTRTHDCLIPNQACYQLHYTSIQYKQTAHIILSCALC